jgi:polar amino acid transport system substrate-binding protein
MRRLLLILTALILAVGLAAAEQEGLDAIRQQGYLRVCADPSNLPFSSSDPATPGFEVELARLLARELGIEARFQWSLTLVHPLQPLREGACDLFMGLPKDDRFTEGNPWAAVSRPYYVMSHALVTKADAGVETLGDVTGKRVAVDAASVADFYLFYAGHQRGLYKGQEEAFGAVVSGEAPAAFLWLPVASWLAQGKPELRVIPVTDPRLEFPIGAGMRRRDRELAAAVDQAIGRLQDSGEAQDPVAAGRTVFATVCSRCHGAEGVGGGPGGTVPTIRNYAGGREKFLRIVENGKQGTAMAPFKGILTWEEILSVYQYLTSPSQ